MAETDNTPEEIAENIAEQSLKLMETELDPIARMEFIYQLWWRWADFQLYIVSPVLEPLSSPVLIAPEQSDDGKEQEFVYPVVDFNHKLSTSKAGDMYSAGMANCKLFYTIEKMIAILIQRLEDMGIDTETEVQIAIHGHEQAQRKAFESVINLSYNVVVTNFDPGLWGERYLQIVNRLVDKGYGYPPEAPRDKYRIDQQAPKIRK